MATDLGIEDRRTKAANLLFRQGFMSMAELVQILGVSESTIRRDMEILEEQGLIRRTHGGAVSIRDMAGHRLAFADRETTAIAEKQAIGSRVARLIPENQTVILDGGTTCFQVARALAQIVLFTDSKSSGAFYCRGGLPFCRAYLELCFPHQQAYLDEFVRTFCRWLVFFVISSLFLDYRCLRLSKMGIPIHCHRSESNYHLFCAGNV